ncbi:hypothetical protein M407DRAFT_235049 [Tulasnella calospora MUT 4182]|uniref:Uncharacterized protein n=1 Tax=Tulasnella calospora MUT 4182 TaxID=1051891 RepID=A0A0C3LYK4_9AGAM|nr:hypothetical protein M407DRAFT_235049 [Tulasnella calospora MUT 4182]
MGRWGVPCVLCFSYGPVGFWVERRRRVVREGALSEACPGKRIMRRYRSRGTKICSLPNRAGGRSLESTRYLVATPLKSSVVFSIPASSKQLSSCSSATTRLSNEAGVSTLAIHAATNPALCEARIDHAGSASRIYTPKKPKSAEARRGKYERPATYVRPVNPKIFHHRLIDAFTKARASFDSNIDYVLWDLKTAAPGMTVSRTARWSVASPNEAQPRSKPSSPSPSLEERTAAAIAKLVKLGHVSKARKVLHASNQLRTRFSPASLAVIARAVADVPFPCSPAGESPTNSPSQSSPPEPPSTYPTSETIEQSSKWLLWELRPQLFDAAKRKQRDAAYQSSLTNAIEEFMWWTKAGQMAVARQKHEYLENTLQGAFDEVMGHFEGPSLQAPLAETIDQHAKTQSVIIRRHLLYNDIRAAWGVWTKLVEDVEKAAESRDSQANEGNRSSDSLRRLRPAIPQTTSLRLDSAYFCILHTARRLNDVEFISTAALPLSSRILVGRNPSRFVDIWRETLQTLVRQSPTAEERFRLLGALKTLDKVLEEHEVGTSVSATTQLRGSQERSDVMRGVFTGALVNAVRLWWSASDLTAGSTKQIGEMFEKFGVILKVPLKKRLSSPNSIGVPIPGAPSIVVAPPFRVSARPATHLPFPSTSNWRHLP